MAATKAAKSSESSPFIKQLASSDRTIRDRALTSLRSYLSSRRSTPFDILDLLKLWKGLHYCMFMSDKPRNQQRLARDLAELTNVFSTTETRLLWLEAFWKTMSREWGGIDSLRMDKYLYLVRCYVNKGFEVAAGSGKWKELEQCLEVLEKDGGPLSVRDVKVPVGLKLHVLDVWVDELDKIDDGEAKGAPVEEVMKPIRKLQKESLVRSVRMRAKESLEDERLVEGKRWRTAEDAPVEDGKALDEEMGEDDGQIMGDDGFGGFDD